MLPKDSEEGDVFPSEQTPMSRSPKFFARTKSDPRSRRASVIALSEDPDSALKLFDEIDQDHSGSLDCKEFEKLLERVGMDDAMERHQYATTFMIEFDADMDTVLSREEFTRAVASGGFDRFVGTSAVNVVLVEIEERNLHT